MCASKKAKIGKAFPRSAGCGGKELEGKGRVVLRASGTEPVVRVMVEARQADWARQGAEQLLRPSPARPGRFRRPVRRPSETNSYNHKLK